MRRDRLIPIRVTEPLNYFREPWYIDWLINTISSLFKEHKDIEKAIKFAKSIMKKASDDGADIGTRVDEIIKTNSIPLMKDSIEVVNCFNAFGKWKSIYEPKAITPLNRMQMIIEGIEVSGEPDLDVDEVTVDLKCTATIELKHWIQDNVYCFMRYGSEALGKKVGILRLDKTTGSYEYVVKDYDAKLVSVWVWLAKAMIVYKEASDDRDDV